MTKDIQQWGDDEHKACYEDLRDLMKKGPTTFEQVENDMVAIIGADLSFKFMEKHIPADLPDEVVEVLLKGMRHAEYRQFTNLTKL